MSISWELAAAALIQQGHKDKSLLLESVFSASPGLNRNIKTVVQGLRPNIQKLNADLDVTSQTWIVARFSILLAFLTELSLA